MDAYAVANYHASGHIDVWMVENFKQQKWIKLMTNPPLQELEVQFF